MAEQCFVMQRKILGLTMADIVHLAYQQAVRNRIKNHFLKEIKRLEGNG